MRRGEKRTEMNRYERNIGIINTEEQGILAKSKVCIVGCGALGGYAMEMLARVGIGYITIVDFDTFEESNLNRQILSQEQNLGVKKVLEGQKRLKAINSETNISAIDERLTKENATTILSNHDIVIDALDSIKDRMILQESCEGLGIPLIFGSVSQWFGQVSTIYPGDNTLNKIFNGAEKKLDKEAMGNISFLPALVASIQVSETLKVLLKKGETLKGKVLLIDLLDNEFKMLI